jgi:hypothetical protein
LLTPKNRLFARPFQTRYAWVLDVLDPRNGET